jgi:tetratricopeptide (TPR) repeat protein
MSAGSAAGGGFDLQASVGAYVEAHIVAREALHWLEGEELDVPIAVSAETGGPGDDLGIEFEGGRYAEIQVKRGLKADARFWDAVDRLVDGLAADPNLLAILVVDQTASEPVRENFRKDLIRFARGRSDALDGLTSRVIDRVRHAGHTDDVLRRLSVQVLQVESATAPHSRIAAQSLAGVLEDPLGWAAAWDVLTRDSLEMISIRGRRDLSSLVALLASRGCALRRATNILAALGAVPGAVPDVAVASASVESGEAASPPEDTPWILRFEETRALQKQGAVRSALSMLERLRKDVTASPASPRLRARIHNNLGAALLDLARPDEAVIAFRMALEYEPEDLDFLTHLAQAELVAGRREDALRHAREVTDRNPDAVGAWAVLVQASATPVAEEDIPPTVRNHPDVLTARALALPDSERATSIDLLKMALRTGRRDPQLLLLIAELLYTSLFPRRLSDIVPEDVVEEIGRLGAEAAAVLEGTERMRMLARAIVTQGAAADLKGEGDRGASLFQRAVTIDPSYERARMAAARAQMVLGNGAAALYLLDGTPEDERSAAWHTLRAASLVLADRSVELDLDIRNALAKLKPEEAATVAQSLGETIIRSERLDLIGPVLDVLEQAEQWDFLHLFRARTAVRQDDRTTAEQEYSAAIETVRPDGRSELQMEFAAYLHAEGEHERSAELFEASGAWTRNEQAAQLYAKSLLIVGRWDQAAILLERLRAREEIPSWVVDLEARIALQVDDVPGAVTALQHLVHLEPDDVDARLRLAQTLLRSGKEERAAETLVSLEVREDLDPQGMVTLAQLLVEVGRSTRALTLAYRALREYPDDPRLHVACVGVFFRAEGVPANLFVREVVVADTWVKLCAENGEEVEYLILSEGPVDVWRNEMLASDKRAQPFLGLRVDDTVTLRHGAANEQKFRVVELKSALLHTFHDALLGYQDRFPGRSEMQALHVGEGESFDPWPFYRAVLHGNQSTIELLDLYRDKRFPIGALADIASQTVRRTYLQLLYDSGIPVYVEEPVQERLEESRTEARKETVVLTATGLTTMQLLGRLDLLPRMFARRLAPQSLLDELNKEIAEWEAARDHGGYKTVGVQGDHTFAFTDITPENIDHVVRQVTELRDTVCAIAEITPRPLVARDDHQDEARALLGANSYDAYMLAGASAGLHTDDWGLRWVSRYERHVVGFSTYALLCVARERGILEDEEFFRDVTCLIGFGQTFIPIDVDLLYRAFAERAYHVDAVMLRLFDILADPAVVVESAIDVAAGFIRELARSPLGKGALGIVTTIILDRLSTGRDIRAVVRGFLVGVKHALRLLPREYEIVRERVSGFVAAKTAELP